MQVDTFKTLTAGLLNMLSSKETRLWPKFSDEDSVVVFFQSVIKESKQKVNRLYITPVNHLKIRT